MRRLPLTIGLLVAVLAIPGAPSPRAAASQMTVIRFASLAPQGSPFMKILKAWSRTLREETSGRVDLRIYGGGSQGDERDYIRKMRAGQLDGAGVSTRGLGMLARPVLVLAAPGVITDYAGLEQVQHRMNAKFEGMLDEAGYQFLGWSTTGKVRIFSTHPVVAPSDLRKARPWAWTGDPIFSEFLKTAGANPVRLALGEVYTGLQTGMVDTVPCSPVAALALQWHTRLKYMTDQGHGIALGATIIKNDKLAALSSADRETLVRTGRRAAQLMHELVRRDDERAYQALLSRGIAELSTSAHKAAWESVGEQTRERLVGRLYSRSLLEQVRRVASGEAYVR